ncbi:MAG: hypothetical protein OEL53_07320 [Rhodospirillales bacterium]|nr:hypothetical protein [Rhodospirillales bacterium]
MALVFLSVTASSYEANAHPIEVGWAALNCGKVHAHLIAPDESWTSEPRFIPITPWQRQDIPHELLICEGKTPSFICRLLNYALEGDRVLSDCQAIDQKLLDRLYRSSGLRQEFELEDAIKAVEQHLDNLGLGSLHFWKCFAKATQGNPSRIRAGDNAKWWREFWESLSASALNK